MSKMRMKKIIWGFFCACLLLSAAVFPGGAARAGQWSGNTEAVQETAGSGTAAERPEDFSLYATAAVLMDADSGRVLYGKNEDAVMSMASTTKIMTCILVLEYVSLEDVLTVSSYAASMPKVKLNVQKGEQYTVRDLLYSLMLESHNDTAVALAEHVGKQFLAPELREKDTADYTVEESKQAVAAFAALMNKKAASLGCENTWFITPNGLDATESILLADGSSVHREHSTTAKELARIMAYCIRQSSRRDAFLEITRTPSYSFSANGRSYSCVNHNAFLNMMDGALTGKTGFTNKAGYCYVGAVERDGRTFVVALLACGWPNNKSYKWSDTRKLMQYGVDNYFYRSFSEDGTAFDEKLLEPLPVHNGQTKVLGAAAYVDIGIAERQSGQQALYGGSGWGTARTGEAAAGNGAASEGGSAASDGMASEGKAAADDGMASEGKAAADDGMASEGKAAADDGTASEGKAAADDGTASEGKAAADDGTASEGKAAADDGTASEGKAAADRGTVPEESGIIWKEGLLLRADESVKTDYSWEKELTAPVARGTAVGTIDYIVDGIVYKRETIVTTEDVEAIDMKWCLRQVFNRFLLTPMSYLCLPVNAL